MRDALHTSTLPGKASEWLLALLDKPNDAKLRLAFSTWYQADQEHAKGWKLAVKAYEAMGEISPKYAEEWGVSKPAIPASKPKPFNIIPLFRPKYAAFAAAACLLVVFMVNWATDLGIDHITGNGDTKIVELADGSRIHMAPNSKLNVLYSSTSREIEMIAGQAFFDVVRNPATPFDVMTENGRISVLGTAFNVNIFENDMHVGVKEGVVAVTPTFDKSQKKILRVGDGLKVTRDGVLSLDKISADYVAAWRNKRLIVNDRPISEIVKTLNDYYPGIIIVASRHIANQPVTGAYQLSNPTTALNAAAHSVGAEVVQITPWLSVVYEKNEKF